jgi:hypothetical protein
MEVSPDLNKKLKKILFALAIVLGIAMFLFTIYGFIRESKQILSEGRGFFRQDLLLRIAAGLLISLFTALPYFVSGILIDQTKKPLYLFIVCLILSAIHIFLTFDVLFFPKGSTDSVALVFLPFYFLILVLISWGIIKIVEKVKKT